MMNFIKKILFTVNPIAGDKDKTESIALVQKSCDFRKIEIITYFTTGFNDEEQITASVKTNNPDRVIVLGGDGTIRLLAMVLKGTSIPIAILPAGSANGMAASLNLPKNIEQQLELAFQNSTVTIDLLNLNNELCMHIADLGINAELVKNYELGKIRGKLGYALKTIPTLWNSTYPFTFKIHINNTTFERKGVLLAFANARNYGTGATLNPLGRLNDGKFEIVIFKNLNFIQMLKTLNSINDFDPEVVEIISTERAIVKCKKPVPFQMDGEYMGETKMVRASLYPEKLLFVVPDPIIEKPFFNLKS